MDMTAEALIEHLKKYPPKTKIMILDGCNGWGRPRSISLAPCERTINNFDSAESPDCWGRQGEKIIVVGYGRHPKD